MRSRAEENREGNRGEPVSAATALARRRACLFLSLIVLVWNVAATGRSALVGTLSSGPWASAPERSAVPPSFDNGAMTTAVGGRTGPLTGRQKFLLGKRVDLNRAGWREISELPGLSDRVAKAVVAERERLGTFRSPQDLLGVPGIKDKRLKKLLPFLAKFPNNN